MSRRAFSLVELAIVLSLLAVVVPMAHRLFVQRQEQLDLARWTVHVADGVRAVSEEVRRDARSGTRGPGIAPVWSYPGCQVTYALAPRGVLERRASPGCGETRALATGVRGMVPDVDGIELTFERKLRPGAIEHATIFIPWPLP